MTPTPVKSRLVSNVERPKSSRNVGASVKNATRLMLAVMMNA